MDQLKDQEIQKAKTSLFKRLFERKALLIFVFAVLVFFIFPHLFLHKKENPGKSAQVTTEEERKLYKESDLKQVLNARKVTSSSSQSRRIESQKERRNYATEIAVFLFKPNQKMPSIRSNESIRNPKLGLPAGTKIPAYLSGTLFSFNVAAPVTVVVTKNIERNGKILIPENSEFLGEAGVLKSLNRINVNFHELIFPDGKQIRVRAMALSEDGSSGIKGRVTKHRDLRVLKALGETALAGASLFAGGIRSEPYAFEDQLRMNLAQNLTQEARSDLRSVKVESSITVDSFTPVEVILLEAI